MVISSLAGPHCLRVFPLLFVHCQSSLHQNVVEDDVHSDVVAGADFTVNLPAAVDNVLRVQLRRGLAAPTYRLCPLFCDHLPLFSQRKGGSLGFL